jgi:hypothetical protein
VHGLDLPTPRSAEIKERLVLYLCPLPRIFMACCRVKLTLILLVTAYLTYSHSFQCVSIFQALPTQPYTHFSSVSTVLLAAPLSSLPYLIMSITVGERYKLWSFSLCNFMYFTLPSSQLDPNSFLNILLSNSLSVFQSLDCSRWCSPSRGHLQSQSK